MSVLYTLDLGPGGWVCHVPRFDVKRKPRGQRHPKRGLQPTPPTGNSPPVTPKPKARNNQRQRIRRRHNASGTPSEGSTPVAPSYDMTETLPSNVSTPYPGTIYAGLDCHPPAASLYATTHDAAPGGPWSAGDCVKTEQLTPSGSPTFSPTYPYPPTASLYATTHDTGPGGPWFAGDCVKTEQLTPSVSPTFSPTYAITHDTAPGGPWSAGDCVKTEQLTPSVATPTLPPPEAAFCWSIGPAKPTAAQTAAFYATTPDARRGTFGYCYPSRGGSLLGYFAGPFSGPSDGPVAAVSGASVGSGSAPGEHYTPTYKGRVTCRHLGCTQYC